MQESLPGNCYKSKMEKSQNYIWRCAGNRLSPCTEIIGGLASWAWVSGLGVPVLGKQMLSPPFTTYIPKRNCDLLVLGFWEVSLIIWKWGHITRITIHCTRKGADKCCTQIISHGICAWWWWWETSHKRQLSLDGFDDHRYCVNPLPGMSNGNYDLAGSLFPGHLFACSHPSWSRYEVSEHCVCSEGTVQAQQAGSHSSTNGFITWH